MGQFFNSRDWLRTPTFVDKDLYEPLPDSAQFDDAPLPSRELRQEMPSAPLPPPPPTQPMREYDEPSVDPGPQQQARQRITLEAAPLPPKPGLMRKIIGMAAGAYMPQVGREIMAPGYDRQMREYNANKQRMMDEGKLNVQAADEEQKLARARAEGFRGGAEQSRGKKMDAEAAYVGKRPIVFNKNQRVGDPNTKEILFEAAEGDDDFIELTPESAKKLGITGTKIPKSALGAYISATKPSEEPTTVKEYRVMIKGENPDWDDAAISKEVSRRIKEDREVALGLKKAQTNRANRPPAAKGGAESAGGGLIPTAAAVVDNPNLFRSYTPTEKAKVIASLRANGHVAAANRLGGKQLSEKSVDHISSADHAMAILDDLAGSFKAAEKYVGPIAGLQAVNPYSDAQKLQAEVDRVRQNVGKLLEGGVLRKEDEIKYTKILATLNDTPSTAASKIGGIRGDIDQKVKAYKANLKKSGYDMSGFDGGAETPPPASDSGSVRMIHPKTGKVHLVPAKDVAAAEAASYKRVK
jgi:hypothetical protein